MSKFVAEVYEGSEKADRIGVDKSYCQSSRLLLSISYSNMLTDKKSDKKWYTAL